MKNHQYHIAYIILAIVAIVIIVGLVLFFANRGGGIQVTGMKERTTGAATTEIIPGKIVIGEKGITWIQHDKPKLKGLLARGVGVARGGKAKLVQHAIVETY